MAFIARQLADLVVLLQRDALRQVAFADAAGPRRERAHRAADDPHVRPRGQDRVEDEQDDGGDRVIDQRLADVLVPAGDGLGQLDGSERRIGGRDRHVADEVGASLAEGHLHGRLAGAGAGLDVGERPGLLAEPPVRRYPADAKLTVGLARVGGVDDPLRRGLPLRAPRLEHCGGEEDADGVVVLPEVLLEEPHLARHAHLRVHDAHEEAAGQEDERELRDELHGPPGAERGRL
jgi:hypothetical protein